jgi:hypothetical protein
VLWRHKILVLFKLLLLEKRVLFFGSPVKPVCTMILSLISLHPQLLNKGLCNELPEPKELKFRENSDDISPVKSVKSLETPDTEKSDDLDSLKQITILPSELWLIFLRNNLHCSLPHSDSTRRVLGSFTAVQKRLYVLAFHLTSVH